MRETTYEAGRARSSLIRVVVLFVEVAGPMKAVTHSRKDPGRVDTQGKSRLSLCLFFLDVGPWTCRATTVALSREWDTRLRILSSPSPQPKGKLCKARAPSQRE